LPRPDKSGLAMTIGIDGEGYKGEEIAALRQVGDSFHNSPSPSYLKRGILEKPIIPGLSGDQSGLLQVRWYLPTTRLPRPDKSGLAMTIGIDGEGYKGEEIAALRQVGDSFHNSPNPSYLKRGILEKPIIPGLSGDQSGLLQVRWYLPATRLPRPDKPGLAMTIGIDGEGYKGEEIAALRQVGDSFHNSPSPSYLKRGRKDGLAMTRRQGADSGGTIPVPD
jgi:hypothetical protein